MDQKTRTKRKKSNQVLEVTAEISLMNLYFFSVFFSDCGVDIQHISSCDFSVLLFDITVVLAPQMVSLLRGALQVPQPSLCESHRG